MRPGRPRKDGPRTAAGALSRAQSAYQNDRPAILMRMRHHRLDYEDARDARAGAALGRLVLKGKIGAELELIGLWYRGVVLNYRRAIRAPEALRRGDGGAKPIEITPEYEAWAKDATAMHEQMHRWLLKASRRQPHYRMRAALEVIVLEDRDAPDLAESLKAALVAMAPFFLTRW